MKRFTYKFFVIASLLVLFNIMDTADSLSEDMFFFSSDQYKNVLVEKVVSADLIVLRSRERIKLIGLKAPEPPKRKKEKEDRDKFGFVVVREDPITTVKDKAFDYAKELLEGKHVRLEFDSMKKDNDFNTLAYVFLVENNMFVNEEILKQGFASLSIRPPNTKYADTLRDAYREARKEKRGLQGQ